MDSHKKILVEEEYADYDSPWKEMLERYFEEFMAFFFPAAHQAINWAAGYEFLDKELQQIVRDAELGRRLVDKLVKLWLNNGEETWVIVHVEVQGQAETEFAKRMYTYNYRIFDRYDRKVASLAVLADERKSWRPDRFHYTLLGCQVSLHFPVAKLLDYRGREEELAEQTNPFSLVVLAYLKTRETAKHPEQRLSWKIALFKLLYQRGYSRQDILELLRFLDWVMVLPEQLEQTFETTVIQYEEEQRMKYVATFERNAEKRGMQRGMQRGELKRAREDVLDILMARFEQISTEIVHVINTLNNSAMLKELLKKAALTDSLEAFEAEARAKTHEQAELEKQPDGNTPVAEQ